MLRGNSAEHCYVEIYYGITSFQAVGGVATIDTMLDTVFLEYIRQRMLMGVKKENIIPVLRINGVSDSEIEEGFATISQELGLVNSSTQQGLSPSVGPAGTSHSAPRVTMIRKKSWFEPLRSSISLYQVAFGVIGTYQMVYQLSLILPAMMREVTPVTQPDFLVFVAMNAGALLFCLMYLLAGALLFFNCRGAKELSLLLSLVQVPVFILKNVQYLLSLGLSVILSISHPDSAYSFQAQFFAGPQFTISLDHAAGAVVGVNLSAVILIILLLFVRTGERTTQVPI